MKTISKINHMLCRIEGWVMVLWFSAVMVVMTAQVISRYILSSPIQWSEEFARYSFAWISYIGCAYCIGVDGHTSITAVRDRLPHKGQKIMLAIGNIIIACVFTRLMPIAINYIAKNGKFPTSVMRIPFKYLYYSFVVGIGLSILQLVLKTILLFDKDELEPIREGDNQTC